MVELATSLTAEYDGVMWVAKRDGVQIGPRYTFAHQALQALTRPSSPVSAEVTAHLETALLSADPYKHIRAALAALNGKE